MTHSQVPPIGVCLPRWSGSCGGHREGCGGFIVFHHILIVDFFDVEGGFGGFGLLNPEIKVIPSISGLPELPVGYHVGVEARDVGDVLEKEETAACGRVNVDLNLTITLHVGTAIAC